MPLSIKRKKLSYLLRVLISIDQLINVVFLNGYEDHTISGRVGYHAYTTSRWYWVWAEKAINTMFFFDPDHCYRSIEWSVYGINRPSRK